MAEISERVICLRLMDFFKENLGEVIGAYFDGEKLFIVRLTEKFETIETDAIKAGDLLAAYGFF